MLTEEKKSLNFVTWVNKLKQYGCYSERLVSELGDKIKNASFNSSEKFGACYEGSLLEVVLFNLCTLGAHINELAFGKDQKGKYRHQFIKVNNNILMKVLLLQHISKCEMFVPQTEKWKRDKGVLYDFNGNMTAQLKVGERSAYLCMKYGIELSDEEYEAMIRTDKDDIAFNSFLSPLSVMVKMINQLSTIEIQRKHDYKTTDKDIKIED